MIQREETLSSKDFSKGLVTRDDMLTSTFDQSPNCSDIKWYFDGSIGKRFGSSTTNSIAITPITAGNTAGWVIDTNSSLSTGLQAYWKLDEASGSRMDSVGSLPLTDLNGVASIVGLRNQAADMFGSIDSASLYRAGNSSLSLNNGNFSIHSYVYFDNTTGTQIIIANLSAGPGTVFSVRLANSGGLQKLSFSPVTGTGGTDTLFANSFGAVNTGTWYSVISWSSSGHHVGMSVNLSVDTRLTTNTNFSIGSSNLTVFGRTNTNNLNTPFQGRTDEVGFWKKILSSTERSNLYGGGSGNTYLSSQDAGLATPWASFDFGASALRWLTVAAGTGIMASSNRGTTFVTIATSRSLTYQYLQRSKNVLIATSDAYDSPLYWAGSATTFAIALAPGSAPAVKYSVNYAGFLVLLNSSSRKLGFFYADENLQLTDPWTSSFDIPSSLDDEITGSFILNKFLYVHTRYTIYLVQFVGGNPDWTFYKVRDFGYVPRTVEIIYLKGQQVAQGLDWDNRLRVFDGTNDVIDSDNIENDNEYCDFSTSKISHAGSGLVLSYSEYDTNQQEYRLGLAIGANSSQTTHHLVLNCRTLAIYPYTNQPFNTMVMAESNNQRALMAFDRSGFCHILNSGNLDAGIAPINEVYDSPLIFSKTPTSVSKSHEIDLFFKKDSSGTIQFQDRADMSNVFSKQNALIELKGTESNILLRRSEDVPSVQNIYQFRLTSSGNTTNSANPWKLVRADYMKQNLGLGKGGA